MALSGIALGSFGLLQGSTSRPLEANPAPLTSPIATSETPKDATDHTPVPGTQSAHEDPDRPGELPTQWPPAPTASYVSFEDSYTEAERTLVLERVALALEGKDTSQFWAVVTRTTYQDGLNALSPDGDVWIAGADDTPALTLRIGGPLSAYEERGNRLTIAQGGGIWAATVSNHSLFGLDGTGYMGGVQLLASGGELPVVPPIDPAVERDPAHVPLTSLREHPPVTPEPTMSAEDAERIESLQRILTDLVPERFTVTFPPAAAPAPEGPTWPSAVRFTLNDGSSTADGSISLWHLVPEASGCEDSTQDVCSFMGGWMYRRADDATLVLWNVGEALTQAEASALLTDPAWSPYLDLIKQQPPT